MSESDRVIILFFLTVGFCVLELLVCISLGECFVGSMGAFMTAAFWYHLWRLKKEKEKYEENTSNW